MSFLVLALVALCILPMLGGDAAESDLRRVRDERIAAEALRDESSDLWAMRENIRMSIGGDS